MSIPPYPIRLSSVQALRGLAAMLVVFFHIYELHKMALPSPVEPSGPLEMYGPWMRGYAGVDLFFVISGFIMVYITSRLQPGWRQSLTFIRNRAIRIYPLWWIFCGLLIVFYMLTEGTPYSGDAVSEGTGTVGYLLKSAFLIPQKDFPILGIGWTLIHEAFFYTVFAGLLLVAFGWRIGALLIWAVLVILGGVMGWTKAPADSYPALALSLFSLEFIAGALAAVLIVKRTFIAPRLCVLIGSVAALTALCFYTQYEFHALSKGRVMVFTLPFVLLIYGAVGWEITKGLTLWKPLVWLGDVSYSLYLCHILVLGVIVRAWPRLPVPQIGAEGPVDVLLFAGVGITASLCCAAVFYYGAERPLLLWMRRRRKKPVNP